MNNRAPLFCVLVFFFAFSLLFNGAEARRGAHSPPPVASPSSTPRDTGLVGFRPFKTGSGAGAIPKSRRFATRPFAGIHHTLVEFHAFQYSVFDRTPDDFVLYDGARGDFILLSEPVTVVGPGSAAPTVAATDDLDDLVFVKRFLANNAESFCWSYRLNGDFFVQPIPNTTATRIQSRDGSVVIMTNLSVYPFTDIKLRPTCTKSPTHPLARRSRAPAR